MAQGHERETSYRSLFEHHDTLALYAFDREGNVIEANSAFERLTGYHIEDLLEGYTAILVDPADGARLVEHHNRAAAGEPQQFELTIRHRHGQLVDLNCTSMPILTNGCIVGVNGFLQDITERRRAERMLEESEQRYRTLFEHNPEALFSFDLDGTPVTCNHVCAALTGYTLEDLQQMPDFMSLLLAREVRTAKQHFLRATQGATQHLDLCIRHKLGHLLEVRVTLIPIIVSGNIIGVYGIAQDITDRKRTEELLRKSDKLNIAGQLAAGVAHEIRNPLTALKGFVQLLQTSPTSKDEYLNIMRSELDRIELIVSEFLFLARPQATVFEPCDLGKILQEVIALLDTQAVLRNIQIHTEQVQALPTISCDGNQIKQVFINVLKNALEAMQGGVITIRVEVERRELVVHVIDQGSGIPSERLPKIGEPFYTTKEKGTGVGLMVSYRILETHGGSLALASEVGVGTTVTVRLPLSI